MHIVQLLLPLYDNQGQAFSPETFAAIRRTLTERFGGVTAHTRAPAQGQWEDGGQTVRDDVAVYEVMADELDRDWWAQYREEVRRLLKQDELVVRAWPAERL